MWVFHHLCAFTLVSAVAIEFMLIRQELRLGTHTTKTA
jgi:uncharacterized membrane protein